MVSHSRLDVPDGALAALALLDCAQRRDGEGSDAIIHNTDPADLIAGLVALCSLFRASMAVSYRVPESEVTDMTRIFLQGRIQ